MSVPSGLVSDETRPGLLESLYEYEVVCHQGRSCS